MTQILSWQSDSH